MNWHKIYDIAKKFKKRRKKWTPFIILVTGVLLFITWLLIECSIFLSYPGGFKPVPGETIQTGNPIITFNYSSSPNYIKTVKLDGEEITRKIIFSKNYVTLPREYLAEGPHKVEIYYHPKLSIWPIKQAWTFFIDTSPPKISIFSPQTDNYYTDKNEMIISGKTEPGCKIKILTIGQILNITINSEGEFEKKFILTRGKNKFKIISTDKAGNLSEHEINAFFDSSPPELSAPFPSDNKIIKEIDPIISVTVSEDGKLDKINMKINEETVPCEFNPPLITYKPEKLSEGKHNIEVNVTDSVGLSSSIKWSFIVDSTEDFGRRTMIFGAIGNDVLDLQKRLSLLGYLDKKYITKTFDEKTLDAVKKFQKKNSLTDDGVVGPATVEKMSYSIVVELSNFTLHLMYNGVEYKKYPIACGSFEYETPTGEFIVINKIKNPTWIPPDSPWAKEAELTQPGPNNPLGTRWIELNTSLVGIHGTNYPDTIGMNVSHGCVRMTIPDVEDLYEYVNIGTRVTITKPIPKPTPVPTPSPTNLPIKKSHKSETNN